MFPNRVPMDRDTPTPEPLVCLFPHACSSAGIPKKEPSCISGKTKSPSTEPDADGRPTYSGVRRGSPRGSLTTLLSVPQCRAAFGTIPSTLAWVDQSSVNQRRSNSHQGIPSTTVTASHVTQGRVQIYDTPGNRRGVGGGHYYLSEICNNSQALGEVNISGFYCA
jgi:hypothetical protein